MSDIADFLRARYTETREDIQRGYLHAPEIADYTGWDKRTAAGLPPAVSALLIADLEAKLGIVDHYEKVQAYAEVEQRQEYVLAAGACAAALKILAQPFAGHPGHKGEEWAS